MFQFKFDVDSIKGTSLNCEVFAFPRGGIDLVKGFVRVNGGEKTPNTTSVYGASAIAQWLAGINNTGYNPVECPFYMELGTGSGTTTINDTGLFVPVAATLQKCSYSVASSGVVTLVCPYVGTSITAGTYTEAMLRDSNSKLFAHKASTIGVPLSIQVVEGQTTTLNWELTNTPQAD